MGEMKKTIALIIVFAFLAAFLIGCKQEVIIQTQQSSEGNIQQITPQPSASDETQEINVPTPTTAISDVKAGQVAEIEYCPIDYAIGYRPGSCDIAEGKLKLTFKPSGTGISGMHFYFIGVSGQTFEMSESTDVSADRWKTYVFELVDIEAKIGGKVSDVLVVPLRDMDGQEKACKNQRLLVVRDQTCRI
ncbi:hypothetical protein KY308_04400 [Candidatus Woesearchaeota archaeon]|nr:hypothetical protein [Candidatus Woesearchaeota archaeon]